MRVLLLAAGLGTRLRPITDSIPKCLVPIGGKPLLQIWLERLTAAGFGPFLINTHYMEDTVKSFVAKSKFTDQVELYSERELLGTAGTVKKNLDFFRGEDGVVLHADNYCMADLAAFRIAHQSRPQRCLMTMMSFDAEDPTACGVIVTDKRGVVTEFYEKVENPPNCRANAAIYIFSPEMISLIGEMGDQARDISVDVLPLYLNRIFSYHTEEFFMDIGTPLNYQKANQQHGFAQGLDNTSV